MGLSYDLGFKAYDIDEVIQGYSAHMLHIEGEIWQMDSRLGVGGKLCVVDIKALVGFRIRGKGSRV